MAVTFYAIGMNYLILFIGALFEGLYRSWYSGNNEALLYETLAETNKKEEYDNYLGKTSSFFQVASGTGMILGGIIAVWSFSVTMWLSVIPQVICLLIAFKLIEPKKQIRESSNIYSHLTTSLAKIWSNRKLRLLSINSVIGYAIGESTYQFRSAFVNTIWPLWAVGFSKVLPSVGAGIGYWYSGRIIKKFGAFKLLLVSNIFSKIINIFSLVFVTVFSPILMSSTSLFFGVNNVAESKLMQKEFTDEKRATLGSISSFFGNFAFGIFAIILGLFADKFGPTMALLFASIISLPTLIINWSLFKDNKTE
jgi:hypothetical protein